MALGAGGFPFKYPPEGRFPYGTNRIDVLAYCLDEGLVFRFIVRDRVLVGEDCLDSEKKWELGGSHSSSFRQQQQHQSQLNAPPV